jgi:hypothetical protein
MSTTTDTGEPMAAARLAEIASRHKTATRGAWRYDPSIGPHFLIAEYHGYGHGIGDLDTFGEGEQAERDREFVLNSYADVAELLDEVERLNDACNGCEDTARADTAKDREIEDLRAEIRQLRAGREDRRGRYLNSEGIGAGADGSQLITWGGHIDQIEVRPNPHGGKTFIALGMLQLDAYKSPETCPQVRVTLTDEHARELADGIYASLDGGGA